jgi:hypothetical protein
LFEIDEEVFHQMAGFIEVFVVFPLLLAIGFGRNHRVFIGLFEYPQDTLINVVALIGLHRIGF